MITIHNAQTRAYIGILHPTECTITEEAGGDYSLSLTHPIDAEDIWTLLRNERLIQAPVPVHNIPAISMGPITYWRTKRATTLWSRLPYVERVQSQVDSGGNPTTQWGNIPSWSLEVVYGPGEKVKRGKSIYECLHWHVSSRKIVPGVDTSYWKFVANFGSDTTETQTEDQQTRTIQKPGIKAADLSIGVNLSKIQEYNSIYMRVRCTVGGQTYEGLVAIADCELVGEVPDEGADEVWTMTADSYVYEQAKTYSKKLEAIATGATYTVIRKHDSVWNYGTANGTGRVGYFLRDSSEMTTPAPERHYEQFETEARTVTSQFFRIYSVNVGMDSVQVEARHISYDLEAKGLGSCAVSEANPPMALDIIRTSVLGDDERKMLTNCTQGTNGAVTGDWSWTNAISALLDPEKGLAYQLKAQFIRDNDDIFLLINQVEKPTYHIMYGVNLLGVDWTESYDGIVTRIIPRGKTQDGGDLFLEEEYIDSDYVSQFVFPRIEVLDVNCQVGQEHTKPDGSKETWTEESCREEMRKQATERFKKDECDIPETTVSIEFLKLGDTEEYRQYRGAENLAIYDWVRVYHPEIGMDFTLQVIGYDWDAIKGRYNSIEIGRAFAKAGHGRQIASWELANQAVGLQTLTSELRKTLGV